MQSVWCPFLGIHGGWVMVDFAKVCAIDMGAELELPDGRKVRAIALVWGGSATQILPIEMQRQPTEQELKTDPNLVNAQALLGGIGAGVQKQRVREALTHGIPGALVGRG